ncbi:unnamed protein product, partial [Symbiodinium necroappetens]
HHYVSEQFVDYLNVSVDFLVELYYIFSNVALWLGLFNVDDGVDFLDYLFYCGDLLDELFHVDVDVDLLDYTP